MYTITYDATDSSGNPAQQIRRTIRVVDTTKPEITRTGDEIITITKGFPYNDPGATCTDNYDTTCTVTTTGLDTIDINTPGDYTITYTVTDKNNNTALPVTRTVKVINGNPPLLTLTGEADITLEVKSPYADQ